MAIDVKWINGKQTVCKLEFPAVWTWSEVSEAQKQLEAMIDQVSHDCAALFVLPSNTKLPMNILSNGLRILNNSHPRIKLFVLVTSNAVVRTIAEMTHKLSHDLREHFYITDTIEQAREALIAAGYLSVEDRIGV
ncbi:MAG: hypothetical protein SNJ59_15875 [Aggregatilineales bacterium]